MRPFIFKPQPKKPAMPVLDKDCGPAPFLKDGKRVTFSTRAADECLWPYGDAGAHMIVCGRTIAGPRSPYCAEHKAMTIARKQPEPVNE